MPLYEYQCRGCGHRFEVLQRLGEGGEGLICPRCGEKEPARQMSTFATSAASGGTTAAAAPSCGGGSGFS